VSPKHANIITLAPRLRSSAQESGERLWRGTRYAMRGRLYKSHTRRISLPIPTLFFFTWERGFLAFFFESRQTDPSSPTLSL
jgi:hypothetical protein